MRSQGDFAAAFRAEIFPIGELHTRENCLHRLNRSCMVRQSVVFCMGANRVIFVILMSVFGTSGCATIERSYAPPTVLAPQSPISSASQNNFLASETALSVSTEPAMLDQSIVTEPERIQTASVVEETIALTTSTSATPKTERVETAEKLVPAKTAPAPTPPAPLTLSADNRLLELLEKDLDKAVEQPRERRRLRFSKEAVANPKVRHFIKYYSTTARRSFQELLARSGKYLPMISKVLSQEGLPEEFAYLAVLESSLSVTTTSPSARSDSGSSFQSPHANTVCVSMNGLTSDATR